MCVSSEILHIMIYMKISSLFLIVAWLGGAGLAQAQVAARTIGSLRLEEIPEIPDAVAERMLRYQNTRAAGLHDFWPDNDGILIATRFAETRQLHWVKLPGGDRRQLTFLREPVGAAAVRPVPGSRELVYSSDKGGAENFQLYLFSLKDGRTRLLTDGKSRHESPLWSRRGDRLVYNGTARNGKDFDFYVYSADSGQSRRLLEVEGEWRPLDWSSDDSKLLVQKYISINETYLYILDVAAAKLTPLFEGQASRKVGYGTARWAGAGILFTSDEAGEFTRLGYWEPGTKKVRWLTADVPWNVEELAVSRDGAKAAFAVNEDGLGRLYLGQASGPFRPADKAPQGQLYGLTFDSTGSRLGFSASTPSSPGDVYALDWASGSVTRWTESETGGLPEETFIAPALIHYPTFDRVAGQPRLIPCFYYKPRGRGPFPVVVDIHGGPEGQERPYFNSTIQYWLNELGIAVLTPNVRGSDGYGKSYLLLDNGFKREDSVKDIGALLDWIAKQPELDKTRAAVFGGSYGGYMVLSSLAHYGDRLKAGVDFVGISNFVTFLKNTKEYRRDLRRAEYGDERDPAMAKHLESISPTTNAGKIRSALFVAQGANDPRVPASEAEQIVREVRRSGNKVWFMMAGDEGHGFQKKTNRDVMGQAVSLFWERHLIGGR
ncbi:MAG TPA: hypothetical protein DEB40_14585 [Elusimicrobia bacterium]|nr:hypothetical protein [Elusimicrobiota bacterium]HBT62961.1 hypothetical protein [Elusimicrobiota bacterium]